MSSPIEIDKWDFLRQINGLPIPDKKDIFKRKPTLDRQGKNKVSPSRPALFESSKIVDSVKHFFKRRRDVLLVFLFGSFATQCIRPSSDIDIGVLFKTVPDRDTQTNITEDLSSILRREIDLVILNQASPVLKMQVLKNGVLLHARKGNHYCHFYTDTINQYNDLKQIRKHCEENILKGRIYAG